jgi:hypothetical protein
MFLDIIHRLVHFLKNHVSETGFCFHPQVKPTQLDGDRIQSPKRCGFLKNGQDNG